MSRLAGSSSTDERGMQVTVAANALGILSLSAEKRIIPGRMIAAARYNKALGDLVKTYGELDGLRVDFVHRRDMYDWEIGMFVEMAGLIETLSIVAKHILQASYVDMPGVPITDYAQAVTDEGIGTTPAYEPSIVPYLDDRDHQVHVVFRDIGSVAHARMAAERAIRQGRSIPGFCHHANRSYGLRWDIVSQPERTSKLVGADLNEINVPYIQVDSTGWAAGYFESTREAELEKKKFLSFLNEYTRTKTEFRRPPPAYYLGVLTEFFEEVITGDLENDLRIREYLASAGTYSRSDSSSLLQDNDIRSALDVALQEWNKNKDKGRRKDGTTCDRSTACYDLVRQKLIDPKSCDRHEKLCGALWVSSERRNDLDILAAQNPQRRTMGSMERQFIASLFHIADKKELGWIKRRRRFELVETRTEFFVVLPIERCVSIWTKRSLYNSFETPWHPHVQSETTLVALSAVCLFSGCVYPDRENAGEAKIDRELFTDNIRNASRGIGYALKRLEDEHRESLLREAASWYRHSLRLSALQSLIWKELHWLDNSSKAWVTRETITLLHRAGVNLFVERVEGGLVNAMYGVDKTMRCPRLPVLQVDCPIPAGGVLLFSCKHPEQETARAIATRIGTDSDSSWSYRELKEVENIYRIGRRLRGTVHRIGVAYGTRVCD